MNYEQTLGKHMKNIIELRKSGFSLIYCGNQEPFIVMLNGEKSTFCSAQIIEQSNNDILNSNYSIKYTLASPYLDTVKIVYNNLEEVMGVMRSMPLLPVKNLSISDLPIISDYETKNIKPDKNIYEYFGLNSHEITRFEVQQRIYYETPELETDFDIGGMEAEYRNYEIDNLTKKVYSKKIERLDKMPIEARALVGDEYEQGTLENRMPEYKKFVFKLYH